MYSFEKLEVWRIAMRLAKDLYALTHAFPNREKFGLTAQIRRSSLSISSNIAEGSARWSKKEQARFYEIAYGSATEALNQLIFAKEMGFIDEDVLTKYRSEIESICKMLSRLYHSRK